MQCRYLCFEVSIKIVVGKIGLLFLSKTVAAMNKQTDTCNHINYLGCKFWLPETCNKFGSKFVVG
jgi:hypothetical protein